MCPKCGGCMVDEYKDLRCMNCGYRPRLRQDFPVCIEGADAKKYRTIVRTTCLIG